jgi:hypothetical protein
MKKIVLGISLFMSTFAFAQNGLEKIIVEKYYVSNAADKAQAVQQAKDASFPENVLPEGSVTYRVYADMLPGYKLLSIFADITNGHKLIFKTTTSFYNNPDGDALAVSKKADISNNVLALDTYLTLGAAATNTFGILKADDDGTSNNITSTNNADGVLLNSTVEMGVPLTTNDGLFSGTTIKPSLAGFDQELNAFGYGDVQIDSMVLADGSVYTTAGAVGPAPADNRVLIAQLTTDGDLSFELNLLLQADSDGHGEFFVANHPGVTPKNEPEYTIPSLTYPDKTVGINTLYKTYNETLFSVYPNPATDFVTLALSNVEANSKGTYTIYGLVGNVIAHKELNNITGNYNEVVDISSFAKGLYTVQMNINGITSTKKIVKN